MTLEFLDTPGKTQTGLVWAGGILATVLAILVVTVPLDLGNQCIFALGALMALAIALRIQSRISTVAICMIAALASTRYIFWRATQTLEFSSPLELLLGGGLFLAEIFAWTIQMLGLMQTIWPLKRQPVAVQGSDADLPTVDIYIPTYNESLSIVSTTVFAAMAVDYPQDKVKVYLLDDGRRPEFRRFAQMAGCGYLTRADNLHAKAGNLNAAMKRTHGELICIFDCDHVATRAFLQMTVGWFQKDPKLAVLQTPHHFYSPDPVQRNVGFAKDIPGEGDLFYDAVQAGNDLWNASFFCGSCAIIRRTALEQTNGFAGETVTEDAHTALKLQRLGWNTAYINLKLSAGLATERLALHIGQRARWARGMTQILRIDNPMLGPGLSLPQRLCYLNAMLHFQFPLPRIVFLTSPLAYLLAGQNIIHASAAMIFAYAAPHLFGSILANVRLQGDKRRMFWSEIYEATLAFHLLRPTIETLFNPAKGKFNVTDKGGILEDTYFDYRSVMPHLIVCGLLVIGILVGFAKLYWPVIFNVEIGTLLLNTVWSIYSLLILTAAIMVARESKQVREDIRFNADLPVSLYFDDGHVVDARTDNVSIGGLSIVTPAGFDLTDRKVTDVVLPVSGQLLALPVETVSIGKGQARVRFGTLPIHSQRRLVVALMGRPDAWETSRREADVTPKEKLMSPIPSTPPPRKTVGSRTRVRTAASIAACAVALGVAGLGGLAPTRAQAQVAEFSSPVVSGAGVRNVRTTFKDMRIESSIRLAGTQGEVGIPFGMRDDEVVRSARLTLNFAYSPALLADLSNLVVLINGEVVRSLPLPRRTADGMVVTLPIDPALILPGDNRLNVRLVGHYTRDCEDPLHTSLWANVSNTASYLDMTIQKLPVGSDLARFPAPFFDRFDGRSLDLPFVFADAPVNAELEAAAAMASHFGGMASYRGFRFRPFVNAIPSGNAVVFMTADRQLAGLARTIQGPSVAMIDNPNDAFGKLLLVMGRDATELKLAAGVLSSGKATLSGAFGDLTGSAVPVYGRYSAPRWLRTDRPVQLGEIVDPLSLVGQGITPGALTSDFRIAPDLFFWPAQGARLNVQYRYPKASWLDRYQSRMDLSLNGQYLQTFPLSPMGWLDQASNKKGISSVQSRGRAILPEYALFGQNELSFYYDLQVADRGRCSGQLPVDVKASIDPTSSIDLTGAHHAARLPNLSLFAGAGFPFTRTPDLGETAVILGQQPTLAEIEAFLALMGQMGDATGAPATRVIVTRTVDADQLADKDILLVGPTSLAGNESLFEDAPVRFENGSLRMAAGDALGRLFNILAVDRRDNPADVEGAMARVPTFEGVTSFRSPFNGDHSVVAVLASQPTALPSLVYDLGTEETRAQVQGDLAIRSGEGVQSFQVRSTYWAGKLPWWLGIAYWFAQRPFMMVISAVIAAVLVAVPLYLALKAQERRRLKNAE